jgi:hypothetical protein
LVEMQDARERFGRVEGGAPEEGLNEVERLRLEVVEVQMRSIRWVPSGSSGYLIALLTGHRLSAAVWFVTSK